MGGEDGDSGRMGSVSDAMKRICSVLLGGLLVPLRSLIRLDLALKLPLAGIILSTTVTLYPSRDDTVQIM